MKFTHVVVVCALGLTHEVAHCQCEYSYEVIEYPCEGSVTNAVAVNNNGMVVGSYYCFSPFSSTAFTWHAETGFTILTPPFAWTSCAANGVNDAGDVCGHVTPAGESERAYLYVQETGEWILFPPDGPGSSQARAVSDELQVVGTRNMKDGGISAFSWTDVTGIEDIGLIDDKSTRGYDIRTDGAVIGWMGFEEAFIAKDGIVTLLGYVPGGTSSIALDINSLGTLAGSGRVDEQLQPACWKDGSWRVLPVPEWADAGNTTATNNAGLVAGSVWVSDVVHSTRATVWQHGWPQDVASSVGVGDPILLEVCLDANESGQLLVRGSYDFSGQAFLLTPIDQPIEDLDGDCRVGTTDLLVLIGEWGTGGQFADINEDGLVDATDLALLLAEWS